MTTQIEKTTSGANVPASHKHEKDIWDITKIIGSVLIAPAIALVGYFYSNAIKEQEIGLQYTKLAIDILKQDVESKNSPLRKWSTSLINEYSKIPLSSEAEKLLLDKPLVYPHKDIDYTMNIMRTFKEENETVRLTLQNNMPHTIFISEIEIFGSNQITCKAYSQSNQIVSSYSSSIIKIISKENLLHCLNSSSMTSQGFEFFELSKTPSVQLTYLQTNNNSITTQNIPFFIKVVYQLSGHTAKLLFGYNAIFAKTSPINVRITR